MIVNRKMRQTMLYDIKTRIGINLFKYDHSGFEDEHYLDGVESDLYEMLTLIQTTREIEEQYAQVIARTESTNPTVGCSRRGTVHRGSSTGVGENPRGSAFGGDGKTVSDR